MKEHKVMTVNAQNVDEVDIPESVPIITVRNTVFFPHQFIPLAIGRPKSLRLIEQAVNEDSTVGVLAQKDATVDHPEPNDLYQVGTIARILKVIDLPDGSKSAFIQGIARFEATHFIQQDPYFKANIRELEDVPPTDELKAQALATNLKNLFQKASDLAPEITNEHQAMIANLHDPGIIADLIIAFANIQIEEKQALLEILDVQKRLDRTTYLFNQYLQTLELGKKIQSEVQDEISKGQREMYLRQQLKAIQKELGEYEDASDVSEIRKRLEQTKLPEDVQKVAEKELDRLSRMHPASAEYTVSRSYLDWLLDLPWYKSTEDNLDISKVQEKLEADHYGLDKVKKRILEYLAVRKLKNDMRGPILCFVGPPGVGKTSLGHSIADALGRNFVRMSLGGVRDEAEIRGHRRTYIGALPGRIIQGIKRAGSNNPVFMLDEIDKVGADFRGDPSSALLEVLDPEQNHTFSDHYLEVPFDLTKVMFIATGNIQDTIIPALRDRMEIIEIPSYTEQEKVQIAKRFLVPKQIKEHGLTEDMIAVGDDALQKMINSYTREAGVRNLERTIASVCRGVAKNVASGKTDPTAIKAEELEKYLGPTKFYSEVAERIDEPGIATGLSWTTSGGDILFIEANKMRGKGNLVLTGHLGDVMKESAHAALSYIRARADEFHLDDKFSEKYDIHIHVPAGAIPKDGPSAGVTLFSALLSTLTEKRVSNDLAMTGEITLRGKVLPVGGVKEKVLAAHRAGISRVILPDKNQAEMAEIPETVKKGLEFIFVKNMKDLVEHALPNLLDTKKSEKNSKEWDKDEAKAEVVQEEVS
ncbi:endopeptidase La [Candidatus Saccharibacteria bacterium]|nr:endopeptidase La [Calditrichia bacterium]NIV72349.1 endopeptidase La [Calditrichia bacterium]NIV99366.1 endopeptidase La [Candidatus Saccharibacteria bacterium]